jgi:hypothetical protein
MRNWTDKTMTRIWFLVVAAAGFIGGFGASLLLQRSAPAEAVGSLAAAKPAIQASGAGRAAGHGGHHDHGKVIDYPAGPEAPAVDFKLLPDPVGGWNLHIQTTNFIFRPEQVNGANMPGAGHAHVYVNGRKLARIYGPWTHLAKLPPRPFVLRVTLNANDHSGLAVGGVPLVAERRYP